MKGRLEHSEQTENKIKELIQEAPDYIQDYYYYLATYLQPKTCMEYVRKVLKFLEFINQNIENINISEISHTDVNIYMTGNNKNTIAYRKMLHSILNNFFEFLKENNKIEKNPVSSKNRPKGEDNVKRYYISRKDVKKILEEVEYYTGGTSRAVAYQQKWKNRDKLMILMFVNTGMRESALSEINVEDINMETGELTVIDKRHKTHKYNLFKSEKLKETLEIWLKERRGILKEKRCEALFISSRNKRLEPGTIINLVYKYTEPVLGVRISPHKLRAAFCTMLYEETNDIELVRDAVGHSSSLTTQKYVVKRESAKEKAANIMAELF